MSKKRNGTQERKARKKNQIKSHLINNVSHHQNFIGHESRIMYLFLFNTSVSGLSQNLFRFWLSLHKKWVCFFVGYFFIVWFLGIYNKKRQRYKKNYYIMDALRKKKLINVAFIWVKFPISHFLSQKLTLHQFHVFCYTFLCKSE